MRRLKTILASLSALLAIVAAALWIRSFARIEPFVAREGKFRQIGAAGARQRSIAVAWTRGEIHLRITHSDWTLSSDADTESFCRNSSVSWWFAGRFSFQDPFVTRRRGQPLHESLGFAFRKTPLKMGSAIETYNDVYLPAWLPVVMFLPWPLIRVAKFIRRQRRARAGRCVAWGYDLRASPSPCPECGAAPANGRRGAAHASL